MAYSDATGIHLGSNQDVAKKRPQLQGLSESVRLQSLGDFVHRFVLAAHGETYQQ